MAWNSLPFPRGPCKDTIRNILKRHKLTKPKKRRGKFRSISYYDWDKIYPLQHFQIDLKVIRDKKSLPWATYQHIQRYKLPPYQWTAIDPYTKTKFLAYSYEKSFSNGLAFMLMIHLWLSMLYWFSQEVHPAC